MREGSVRKRGSSWGFVVDVTPPGAAVRKQKRGGGFRTKREALAAMAEVQAAVAAPGGYVEPTKATVAEYLREWLEAVRGEYAPSTWDAARHNVDGYIIPRIGELPLVGLTTTAIKAMYADLRANGRQRPKRRADGTIDRSLSPKAVYNVHRTLSRALNDATRETPPRLPANPAARAMKPPRQVPQPVWTAEQLQAFFAATAEGRFAPLWRLAAASGLRRGELAGLRWGDVDLQAARVSVSQQRAKGGGSVATRPPKGQRGRMVSLDPATVEVLRAWRRRQVEEKLAFDGVWGNDDDLVFCSAQGMPLHPDSITKRFNHRREQAGLPKVNFHGLRHSHATLALQAGVDIKVVQERLGHASVAITGDIYSHVTPGMQEDAAARVAAVMDGASRV